MDGHKEEGDDMDLATLLHELPRDLFLEILHLQDPMVFGPAELRDHLFSFATLTAHPTASDAELDLLERRMLRVIDNNPVLTFTGLRSLGTGCLSSLFPLYAIARLPNLEHLTLDLTLVLYHPDFAQDPAQFAHLQSLSRVTSLTITSRHAQSFGAHDSALNLLLRTLTSCAFYPTLHTLHLDLAFLQGECTAHPPLLDTFRALLHAELRSLTFSETEREASVLLNNLPDLAPGLTSLDLVGVAPELLEPEHVLNWLPSGSRFDPFDEPATEGLMTSIWPDLASIALPPHLPMDQCSFFHSFLRHRPWNAIKVQVGGDGDRKDVDRMLFESHDLRAFSIICNHVSFIEIFEPLRLCAATLRELHLTACVSDFGLGNLGAPGVEPLQHLTALRTLSLELDYRNTSKNKCDNNLVSGLWTLSNLRSLRVKSGSVRGLFLGRLTHLKRLRDIAILGSSFLETEAVHVVADPASFPHLRTFSIGNLAPFRGRVTDPALLTESSAKDLWKQLVDRLGRRNLTAPPEYF